MITLTDKIKLHRFILLQYAGYDCHMYSKTGFKHIYKSTTDEVWGNHDWKEVIQNVTELCTELGIHIEVEHYPKEITLILKV